MRGRSNDQGSALVFNGPIYGDFTRGEIADAASTGAGSITPVDGTETGGPRRRGRARAVVRPDVAACSRRGGPPSACAGRIADLTRPEGMIARADDERAVAARRMGVPMESEDRPPLDRFIDDFRKDIEAASVRPLTEYLTRFPGDDSGGIAREYEAAAGRGRGADATESRTRSDGDQCAPDASRRDTPSPGTRRIGPYRVVRELGRGGQGAVYLAEDTRMQRQVALKVLLAGSVASHDTIERFRREAEITSAIDDPGICPTYEVGVDETGQWIAMRYVEGRTLAVLIGDAKAAAAKARSPASATTPTAPSLAYDEVEVDRTLHLVEKVARTLHAAHERGVMHRDIKPGNIIVTRSGDPVILDFGLAGHLDTDHSVLTQTGEFFGTPAYMSPEQLPGSAVRLDARTDALAVALYEALTLRRPFEHPTREGLLYVIQMRDPQDPRTIRRAIPRDCDTVLAVGLEKDRGRRYQSALDFAEDLRRVRCFEPILAKPASVWIKLRRWGQRRPAAAALVLALAVLVPSLTAFVGFYVVLATARNAKGKPRSVPAPKRSWKKGSGPSFRAARTTCETARRRSKGRGA